MTSKLLAVHAVVAICPLFAQVVGPTSDPGVIIPESSIVLQQDAGIRAHTNHLIRLLPRPGVMPAAAETPATLAAVYGVAPNLGQGVIAIVDAFDYPTAASDLNYFSNAMGLPALSDCGGNFQQPGACFQVVYASGSKPPTDTTGWSLEAALDIEYAHAMAPNAKIVLVEANSNSNSDLFLAVDVATSIVQSSLRNGQVSMSWGGGESSGETSYDSHFMNKPGVVYFASSGDTGAVVEYPSASPYVVSVGGTTINRDQNGNFLSETAWKSSGGGPSRYERRPAYQDVIQSIVGFRRGTPDVSLDADPNSGVKVWDTTPYKGNTGWYQVGGTSLACPATAGIVNAMGSLASSVAAEQALIYAGYPGSTYFRDITQGTSGRLFDRYQAAAGWDFITGVGSSLGNGGK